MGTYKAYNSGWRAWAQYSTLPASIALWCGMWGLIDKLYVEPDPIRKGSTLVVIGAIGMVLTNTFFSSAYAMCIDKTWTSPLQRLMRRNSATWIDTVKPHFMSLLAVVGTIMFWLGVDGVVNQLVKHSSYPLSLEVGFASLGLGFVVYCIHVSEDAELLSEADGGVMTRSLMHGGDTAGALSSMSFSRRAKVILQATACNVAQVLLWWGTESTTCAYIPLSRMSGVVLLACSLATLKIVDRLEGNMHVVSPVESLAALHKGGDSHYARLLGHAVELVAVVVLWLGLEWMMWGRELLNPSISRDIASSVCSVALLMYTGALAHLSGIINPISAYGELCRLENDHQMERKMEEIEKRKLFKSPYGSVTNYDLEYGCSAATL